MATLKFTVDSALLEELGQRLVGKPYIALAELVKNGYDADATEVKIGLDPEKDQIVVVDNGHGMDFEEFKDFWMRIGSTHKFKQRISRNFKRPMTGSKGIGRLAVQYLARELDLITTSEKDLKSRLEAHVNWEEAVKTGDLTDVTVEYRVVSSEVGFDKGTKIILSILRQTWDTELIRGLAKEIWWLQPPFHGIFGVTEDKKEMFGIDFSSSEKNYMDSFRWQINAILDIWNAKLVGRNTDGDVVFSLEFHGEEPIPQRFRIDKCKLHGGDFEIRIYKLQGRQLHGMRVGEARDYLNVYGGVHVYDGGFHLPYYGIQTNDWLGIEFDHSHRLSASQLLPDELQVPEGMTYLPTVSRILGVVNVDTSKEDDLKILITRDRLQERDAFKNLVGIVRYALDFYANEMARRELDQTVKRAQKPKVEKVEDVLVAYQAEIPEETYERLKEDVQKVTAEIETEAETTAKQLSLMGPLATAGISSLAFQHEVKRQFSAIDDIIGRLEALEGRLQDQRLRKTLNELVAELSSWVMKAKDTNALFAYLGDAENIKTRERFSARQVVEEVKGQVKSLARGIPIETSRLDDGLFLPKATLAEWASVFQNVFLNAFNAMIDSKRKRIEVSSRTEGGLREILVQNTGTPVNLKDETLFKPFERRVKISPERQALGYGGTGLGLTIVRLTAYNIGCEVSFVQPEKGFSTAFSLRWREAK